MSGGGRHRMINWVNEKRVEFLFIWPHLDQHYWFLVRSCSNVTPLFIMITITIRACSESEIKFSHLSLNLIEFKL